MLDFLPWPLLRQGSCTPASMTRLEPISSMRRGTARDTGTGIEQPEVFHRPPGFRHGSSERTRRGDLPHTRRIESIGFRPMSYSPLATVWQPEGA